MAAAPGGATDGGRLLRLPMGDTAAAEGRPGGRGPMSLEAMQAAVVAIRGGVFDPEPVQPRAAASPATDTERRGAAVSLGCPAVVVLAGHAGAGASTVALAVAEAVAAAQPVLLVEYADPRRSGLGVASDCELGVDEQGWRRGRRSSLRLARLGLACPPVPGWPVPPSDPRDSPSAPRLLVLDAGHLDVASLAGPGWLPGLLDAAQLVVVTRITVPAVRQTEHLLGALPAPAVVATVGSGRWPGVVTARCGPHLRAARAGGRAVMVPTVRRLEVDGLTADPLPKPVAAAGKALAAQLSPDQPPLTGLSLSAHGKGTP